MASLFSCSSMSVDRWEYSWRGRGAIGGPRRGLAPPTSRWPRRELPGLKSDEVTFPTRVRSGIRYRNGAKAELGGKGSCIVAAVYVEGYEKGRLLSLFN